MRIVWRLCRRSPVPVVVVTVPPSVLQSVPRIWLICRISQLLERLIDSWKAHSVHCLTSECEQTIIHIRLERGVVAKCQWRVDPFNWRTNRQKPSLDLTPNTGPKPSQRLTKAEPKPGQCRPHADRVLVVSTLNLIIFANKCYLFTISDRMTRRTQFSSFSFLFIDRTVTYCEQ